jgi:hypothetical protein
VTGSIRWLKDWWGWLMWRRKPWGRGAGWAGYREMAVRWRAGMEARKGEPLQVIRIPEPLTREQADLVMDLYAQLQPAEYGMDAEVVMNQNTFDQLRPREVEGQPRLFGMRVRVDNAATTPRLEPSK